MDMPDIDPRPDAANAGGSRENPKVPHDSAITTVRIAVGNDVREQGTPVKNHEIQIGDLAERLTRHDRRADKMGKYFCAPMRDGARNADGALPWGLFCLDFDGKHDKPDPDVSKAFFAGIWHVGYSTHRYTPENGKHRVVLLLNREITADEHRRLFNALAEVLPFAPDDKLNHPDQPVFLPSCPPGSAPVAWFNDGKPFDVDAALAEHGRKADAESHASKAYKPAGDSVIAAFNAAHDLAAILERHGYLRKGRRLLHPNSESGIPSVSILRDGAICFSHSSSDPLGDGKAHDAFDVFRILDHGGDARAAVKTASAMLGMQGERDRGQASSNGSSSGTDDWRDPLPIPKGLAPVAPFDADMLPEAFRAWVCDIADRMQCPVDFPAVGAMVALSSVIGRRRVIAPKRFDDWTVTPNLWGCIVGRPGVMKSPALAQVILPLDRLGVAAADEHKAAMKDYEVSQAIAKMTAKADEEKAQKLVKQGKIVEAEHLLKRGMSGDGDGVPAMRRYKVTDASVEALGEILETNPFGTLVYRDELSGLLKSLDKEGQESARSFYLQGYDGVQSWTSDRIGRGKYRHIDAVCLAMLGGIQPGKIQSYIRDAVRGGAGDDGLLQRFGMLVWPDVVGDWKNVDRWPDNPAKNQAFAVFERLDMLMPDGDGNPITLKFSPAAQSLFDEWREGFESMLRAGDLLPALESHLAKHRKLIPALALVCGLADGETDAISEVSLARALDWYEYLRTHAERAYRAGQTPETEGAKSLLSRIRAGDVADGFKAREIYLKGWAHLACPEDAKAAVDLLHDLGHLSRVDGGTGMLGGRPTATYRINPKTLGGA